MSQSARTYRGFRITSKILEPDVESGDVPVQPSRAVARRGCLHIEEPQPITDDWDAQARDEIDRLLDPTELRDVNELN